MLATLASELCSFLIVEYTKQRLDHGNIKRLPNSFFNSLRAPACFAELDASRSRVPTCLGKKGLNFRKKMVLRKH